MKFNPLHNHVIVKKVDPRKMRGGLYIPETARAIQTFEVVAVGPGAWRGGVFVETTTKEGDHVIINGSAGFILEDMEYQALPEENVIAILVHEEGDPEPEPTEDEGN